MPRSLLLLSACAGLFVVPSVAAPGAAAAQPPRASGPEAVARVDATLECLVRQRSELDRAERLLVEARDQLRATAPGSAAHADAARSAEVIEARLGAAGRAIAACVPGAMPSATPTPTPTSTPSPTPTRTSTPSPTPTPNPNPTATAPSPEPTEPPRSSLEAFAVSGPVTLTDTVHVVRGLKVDGLGDVESIALNRAVARVAGGMHRCYEQAVHRGALVRGELDVVFTVRPDGRTLGHALEGSTLGDAPLEACLTRIARRIAVGSAATGGTATYSYRMRFGPM